MGEISLYALIQKIKNPKEQTIKLQREIANASLSGDMKEKTRLKKMLYTVIPSVWFPKSSKNRKQTSIGRFTGLTQIDIDGIKSPTEAVELKHSLFESCDFIVACWISPSHKGVKAIARIPIVQSVVEFKSYYRGLRYALEDLSSGHWDNMPSNPVQVMFLGHDPDVLYRIHPDEWTVKIKQKELRPVIPIIKDAPDHLIEWRKKYLMDQYILTLTDINIDGHPTVRGHSIRIGGFVGSGLISINEAYSWAEYAIKIVHT